jgi:hypothetical protein
MKTPVDDLQYLADNLESAAGMFRAFADIWDELDGAQRMYIQRLFGRGERLLRAMNQGIATVVAREILKGQEEIRVSEGSESMVEAERQRICGGRSLAEQSRQAARDFLAEHKSKQQPVNAADVADANQVLAELRQAKKKGKRGERGKTEAGPSGSQDH